MRGFERFEGAPRATQRVEGDRVDVGEAGGFRGEPGRPAQGVERVLLLSLPHERETERVLELRGIGLP